MDPLGIILSSPSKQLPEGIRHGHEAEEDQAAREPGWGRLSLAAEGFCRQTPPQGHVPLFLLNEPKDKYRLLMP